MNKRLFSLVLSAFMAVGTWAQEGGVSISVNAGPQWSSHLGVTAGVDALIPFGKSRWGFEPGLYWSMRNTNVENTTKLTTDNTKSTITKEYSDKTHYISVPLRVALRVVGHDDSAFKMSLLFGPYLAYGLGGTSHCTVTKDGAVTKSQEDAFGDKGRLQSRFDYGLNMGISAVVRHHVRIGVFTEIGLKDIYRPTSLAEDIIGDLLGGVTKVNTNVGVTVGYQF